MDIEGIECLVQAGQETIATSSLRASIASNGNILAVRTAAEASSRTKRSVVEERFTNREEGRVEW